MILAAEGFARAGGTEILQGTDIRVAGESAVFGVTEVQRGLFPMAGSAVRLRRQIGYAVAAEMLLAARTCRRAAPTSSGSINHVVPDGQALAKAKEIAERIAQQRPARRRRRSSRRCARPRRMPEEEAFEIEQQHGMTVMTSEDAQEGPRAFLEKRAPVFRGR